jgi:hypothetical protein
MLARIRKALVAGGGAGLAAAGSWVAASGLPTDADAVGQVAGVFLAAALPVGWATWRVRNKAEVR